MANKGASLPIPDDEIPLIQSLLVPLVGADIVELNPGRDSSDIAALKLLKEICSVMLR